MISSLDLNLEFSNSFVRHREVALLEHSINNHKEVVLCGEAGVGKTSVAKMYALNQNQYENKLYFRCGENIDEILNSMQDINYESTLIIVDDIPSVSIFVATPTYKLLKTLHGVHIILISRDDFFYPTDFFVIKIHGISLSETKAYLQYLLDDEIYNNYDLINEIYGCTNGNILAIRLLCVYIQNSGESIYNVIASLKTLDVNNILYKREYVKDIDSSLKIEVRRQIEGLIDEECLKVLIDICAFGRIKYDTYLRWMKEYNVKQSIEKLCEFSLLIIENDVLRVNNIIRQLIWCSYSPDWSCHSRLAERMLEDLANGVPDDEELFLSLIKCHIDNEELLIFIEKFFKYNKKSNYDTEIKLQLESMLNIISSYRDCLDDISHNVSEIKNDVYILSSNTKNLDIILQQLIECYEEHSEVVCKLSEIYDSVKKKKRINLKLVFDAISLMGSFASIYSLNEVKSGVQMLLSMIGLI